MIAHLHPTVSRYLDLQAGLRLPFPADQIAAMRTLEGDLERLVDEGDYGAFIAGGGKESPDTAEFRGLPSGRSLPGSLALTGPAASFASIRYGTRPPFTDAYVRLDRLRFAAASVPEAALDAALQALNDERAPSLQARPQAGVYFATVEGAAWARAAWERGDTHVRCTFPSFMAGPPPDALLTDVASLDVAGLEPARTRREHLRRALNNATPAWWMERLRRGSVHPVLLSSLWEAAGGARRTHPHRVLAFLEMLCRYGFCENGRPRPPSETPVAFACFRQNVGFMETALRLEHPVVAVEAFARRRPEWMDREPFASALATEQLRCLDFGDPRIAAERPRVVIAQVAVDESAETLLKLSALPGSILAVLEIGLHPPRSTNHVVDRAPHFNAWAARSGADYGEMYSDLLAAPEHADFFGTGGGLGHQEAFLVKRQSRPSGRTTEGSSIP